MSEPTTSGTRVTAVELVNPGLPQSVDIRDDYVIVTDGTAQITSVQAHGNGTHVITIKGVRR
jgi:hypothetical protein